MNTRIITWRILMLAVMATVWHPLYAQEPTVITSDEFEFIWPVPATWEKTQSLTKSQFAIKPRGNLSMACTLLTFRTSKATLESLLRGYQSNNAAMFKGIKERFPDSTFLSSEITKIGSLDAIKTEAIYELKNLSTAKKAYVCQIATIRHGIAYSINFECEADKIEEGKRQMASVLAAFSFLK